MNQRIGDSGIPLDSLRSETALEEAITAYREALKEQRRELVPFQWAAMQMCLGNVFHELGTQRSGTVELEYAVSAYKDALNEYTRARAPLQWATIQMNLGSALFRLGDRDGTTARLEAAAVAYHAASKEYTPELAPLSWAAAIGNQGIVLARLAERQNNLPMARRAVELIQAALAALRDGGDTPSATYFEALLLSAHAAVQKLAKKRCVVS